MYNKDRILSRTFNSWNDETTCENVPHLEITEVALAHCNIVNNDYQQDSKVLNTFVPNKSFGQLLDISSKNFIFLETFDPVFSYVKYSSPIKFLNCYRLKIK